MTLHLENLKYFEDSISTTSSYVILCAPHDGLFAGKAECDFEDMENASQYFGGRIAAHKAAIKYYKHKRKQGKACIAALQETYDILKDMKTTDKKTLSKIRRQIYDYKGFVSQCDNAIAATENQIKKSIEARENLLKVKTK